MKKSFLILSVLISMIIIGCGGDEEEGGNGEKVATRTYYTGVLLGHEDYVHSVAFSPDGSMLASSGGSLNSGGLYLQDYTIRLWNTGDGSLIRSIERHTDIVGDVTFSPDGRILASSSYYDATIRLWNAGDGTHIETIDEVPTSCVVFSPDSKTFASSSYSNSVVLWDMSDKKIFRTFEGHTEFVRDIAFSPDGKTLVSGGKGSPIILWNVADATILHKMFGHQSLAGGTGDVLSLAFSPDGKMVASSAQYAGEIHLWDVAFGKNLYELDVPDGDVMDLAFSPDGSMLAAGEESNGIRLWNMKTRTEIRLLEGHTNDVRCVAFSPDGRVLASGSDDETVRMWKVK